jgi:hypothetical protein
MVSERDKENEDPPMMMKRRSSRRGGIQESADTMAEGLKCHYDESAKSSVEDTALVDAAMEEVDLARTLNPAQFEVFLQRWGIPVEDYGMGNAKHVRDLWTEVILGDSKLEIQSLNGGCSILLRRVVVVVIELCAEVNGKKIFLILKDMMTQSGSNRKDLNRRITRKMFADEDENSAIFRCVHQNLNIREKTCQQLFEAESKRWVEEAKCSDGFPGLTTRYSLCIVRMRVCDPVDSICHQLGLPEGREFETTVDGAMDSGSTRRWTWWSSEKFQAAFPPPQSDSQLSLQMLRSSSTLWVAVPLILVTMLGSYFWNFCGRTWSSWIRSGRSLTS